MSNHFSAADLESPGNDARLDVTDLFVFAAPDNPDRTVLIKDSCDVFSVRMIFMVHGQAPRTSYHTKM
jgi:hypothetical protein